MLVMRVTDWPSWGDEGNLSVVSMLIASSAMPAMQCNAMQSITILWQSLARTSGYFGYYFAAATARMALQVVLGGSGAPCLRKRSVLTLPACSLPCAL